MMIFKSQGSDLSEECYNNDETVESSEAIFVNIGSKKLIRANRAAMVVAMISKSPINM